MEVVVPNIATPIEYPIDLDITFTDGTAGRKLCSYCCLLLAFR